ncbi:hypothetical protein ACH5RR_009955 [Cinchona calisaya]|uniref:Uncharacterized protein n=1 Tax=Cinchona calisaya TaxID=153742 RepID=A0ABD3AHA6_9GENT
MMSSLDDDAETQLLQQSSPKSKKGGWITFPFLIATRAGMTVAALGWSANLIVYLIDKYNIESIDAAQIFNVVNGCMALFPIIVAIIADSFLGCFAVIWISSIISLLGMFLLTLTATISSLRPAPCNEESSFCTTPSPLQYTNLFLAVALASIGCAGTSFTVGTMGADQLDNPEHQENFFNWFLFVWNAASIISATVIVYVQDNVSWGLGYGLCAAANLLGLFSFLLGKHYYRYVQPQGSPFKDIARVLFAAFSKRKVFLSTRNEDYFSELHLEVDGQHDGIKELAASATPHKETFKFLNHAALISQADIQSDGSIRQSWKLCTVQQVEDLKTLLRIAPIWATGIFLTTPMGMLSTLTVLQALTMDTCIVSNFKFPVGSLVVFSLLSGAISLTIVDRLIFPLWQKTFGKTPTPLQRLGTGHVLNVLSIVIAALVESKRLQIARASYIVQELTSSTVPMSVFWLVPQLALSGMGEAFHFPGQASLYYQEFPASLKSTSTAMVALLIAIGYYLSTALTDFVRKVTNWLPDDLNHGRLNYLYWVLAMIGALNFGLYLTSAGVYKYRNDQDDKTVDNSSNQGDATLYY